LGNAQAGGYYFAPPSKWPVVGSIALFIMATGGVGWMNFMDWGFPVFLVGLAILFYMLFGWFGDVIRESEGGLYNKQVDVSFRWSMSWFIFSEVMFFAAFFGALFYARVYSVPWLADLDNKNLWPTFDGFWPASGPYIPKEFTPMGAWGIPAFNTFLLLSSGVTVTLAHWALLAGNRSKLVFWLAATVALGAVFMGFQVYEYIHAYRDLNLKLTSGVFGSTFFLLTGFHGFHVTLGAIMLTVIMFRAMKGHFTPERHFAFEAVAWYWHFVDVVWLGLFIFVYWV
jgi:cytochrome c oxidase subunit III